MKIAKLKCHQLNVTKVHILEEIWLYKLISIAILSLQTFYDNEKSSFLMIHDYFIVCLWLHWIALAMLIYMYYTTSLPFHHFLLTFTCRESAQTSLIQQYISSNPWRSYWLRFSHPQTDTTTVMWHTNRSSRVHPFSNFF